MLFIVQSPYWFTIGRPGVLSLGGWTPHVHAEFHEHRATLGLASYCSTGLSPSVVDLSRSFTQLLVYPLSLAATYGVAFCFPFLRLLRCFSSPGSPRCPMNSDNDDPEGPGFPIRKSTDQSLFAAPHGLSQRTTSFIASCHQGIHQMPLGHLIALIINVRVLVPTPAGHIKH